jgi:hypothetical protein
VIKEDEMGEACSVHGGDEKCVQLLLGKPEGKRPVRRLRHRREDNIKMDLREIGFGCVDWIHLAQDRDWWRALVNTEMNFGFHEIRGIS